MLIIVISCNNVFAYDSLPQSRLLTTQSLPQGLTLMNKHFLSVIAGVCIAFAGTSETNAQRIVGLYGNLDSPLSVVRYNPYNDAIFSTGYVENFIDSTQYSNDPTSYESAINGSTTIDPFNGRYFMLREFSMSLDNTDSIVRMVRLRAINSQNGSFQTSPYASMYSMNPHQFEFSLQSGKLYAVDKSFVPKVRLLEYDFVSGDMKVIGTYDIRQRQTGDKYTAFDSDNERFVYITATEGGGFFGTPAVAYIDVKTGELTLQKVFMVSNGETINTIEGAIYESQYDDVTDNVIAVWAINNQPAKIVKINQQGEMKVIYTVPDSLGGGQTVFDQATGRLVLQTGVAGDPERMNNIIIDVRAEQVVDFVSSVTHIANMECDNSEFAALRFRKEVTSVDEEEVMKVYSISPNPSSEGTVTLRSTKQITSVEVVSAMGENVYTQSMSGTQEKFLQIPTLASGTYMIRVQFTDGTSSARPWSVVR